MKLVATSILLAGLMIAAAFFYTQRYVIAAPANSSSVWVLDRTTGNLLVCGAGNPQPTCIRATSVADYEIYQPR